MGCVDVPSLVSRVESIAVRLLMVVNVDWFFLSHRLPVALGALQAGYEVHIATSLTRRCEKLEAYGFKVHPLEINRSAAGPVDLIKLLLSLVRLFWAVKPDLLHLVTIKPVLLGGLAARVAPVGGVVFAVSGLGHVFVADGFVGQLRRTLVRVWYGWVLGVRNMRIIFQNPDDRRVLTSVARLRSNQVVMIPGSGVDLSVYKYLPLPQGVPVIMMAARLLVTKGVREFVNASQYLFASGVRAEFWLVGDVDGADPASIQSEELESWKALSNLRLLGARSDIPELMAQTNLVVLPSFYGEGLPKVLIEAAACGRPVITTDLPGCRDAIEEGVTGILVPPRDYLALAVAIRTLLEDQELCQAMGSAGRKRSESLFDVNAVVKAHLKIYRELAHC